MELKSRKSADDVANWILDSEYEEVVLIDGLDDAFIGCTPEGVAIYNVDRCAEIVAEDSNMPIEDAIEYVQYNVVGAYVGPKTPLFIEVMNEYRSQEEPG
jgi:hypothetical protein